LAAVFRASSSSPKPVQESSRQSAQRLSNVRVDLLTPCFWPEVRRGTERFARDLADGLIADGHRPRLITSHPGRFTRRIEDGLEIVRVPRPSERRLRRRRIEEYLTHLPLSYAVLRAGDAELAHGFNPGDALAAARWSRHTGRPAVFSYMGVPDHAGLMYRRRRLEVTKRALDGCSATIALSRYAAAAFERWLGAEVRVIYPGVELERFPLGTARTDAPTIVCAATLTEPRKRVALLAEAHRIVRRSRPDARLLLDRPRDERLAESVADPGNGIELMQMNDRNELAALTGNAWAAALPSFGEAFGLVLVEALATGTPVVGSANGAFPEIVDRPEVGRLFDGDSPELLARALLEVLELSNDRATRTSCRARAEDFSTKRTVAAYEQLYSELLAR
jgi:glycosyltransferase involved in cell wall biosynthesis